MASKDKFVEGFKRFKKQYFVDDSNLYDSMKNGQPAKTMMVACCDARVDPAILTDGNPGDLFTVRNVANLIPPCETGRDFHGTSAALEFAVNILKVENIIIMGHASCEGIKALWHGYGAVQSRFMDDWVSIAQPAKEKIQKTFTSEPAKIQIKACEQQAILVSLGNLLLFPCIRRGVENGSLSLHGWYFDISVGELLSYNSSSAQFEIVTN